MAAAVPAKIHKLILDIKDCIKELQNEFTTSGMPIDEDSTSLHNFCTKLEYLLLVGMKENYSLFGSRKLYWEYFCKCLASKREIHDGLIFVKSVPEFKTSLGRGRAFIRYCLVHQCLADTLQQCFQNTNVTRDYYLPESLQLQQEQLSYLLSILYDLNEIQFDLSSHGHDLDVSWPTFARKVFGSPSRWRAPSRTASLTSLISVTSQQNEVMQSVKNNVGEGSQNRLVNDLDSSTEAAAVANVERRRESDETESPQRNIIGDEHHDETNIQKSESLVQNSAVTVDVPISHDEGEQKKDFTDDSVSSEKSLREVNDNESTPLGSGSGSHCPSQDVCNQSCSDSNETVKEASENDLLLVEVKNLREANALLKDRAEKWKKVVSGFSEKLAIKEKVNGHLEKQVNALKESVAALKEIMQVKIAEANSLKRMVEEFKALRNVESNANNADEKIRTLECENSNLKEELSNLNINFEKLKMDLSSKLKLLEVQATTVPTVDAGSSTMGLPQDDAQCEIVQLTKKLEASYLENQKLTCRLNKMQQILSQVEKAEEELEKLEAAEGNSSNFNSPTEESDDVESPQTDNDGDNNEFGHNEPTVNFVLCCDQPVIYPEDSLVFTVVNRTVGRLKRLISEKNDLQLQLLSSNEMNNSLISKVQEQEEQLSTVVFELSEAKSLVEQLKKSHSKLQTAEAILRYELKEKRSVVERMKHMLESSRTQWMRIRQKHAESEVEWHSLRADFANRVKQESMESGFVEDITADRSDERESSVVPDDDTDKQLQSPTSSDSPNFPSDPVDLVPARLPLNSPTGTGELEDLPESPREEDDEDLSSSDGERRRNTRTRLRIMEEQCQQLYSRLVASVKKSEFLEWKLSELHEQHGPGDVDPTPKETTAETLVKDVNSNFDALFVPYSSDAGHSSSITPVDDMLELRDSIGEGDRDTTPTEGEISESFSCDMDGATVEDVGSPSADQLSQNSVVDGDLIADDSSEPLDKPPPLILAKALPKRIVLLRKKKEDLEEHMKKMTEEKTISDAREADLLSQLETLRASVAEKDSHINSLTSEKADLIQREAEFKRRAEFIMRKEREGNDALDKVNQDLESKLNSLQGEIQEKQEMISTLEGDFRKSSEEHLASILTLQQEVASLKFQLSSETLQREIALKSHAYHKDQIVNMQKQITEQEQSISELEIEMEEIKVDRDNEKDQHKLELNELKMCLTSREEECAALNDNLKVLTRQYDDERNQSSHLAAMCKELKGDNIKLKEEREELTGDLIELKKKMIKLIKEKDLLWKRSERLNFIQKVQASDRWLKDEEVTHCLGCKTEFSLIIRKHHCRLCGRIFCSTCCNHWAMTTSSSRKVRVCGECLLNHSHIEPDSVGVDSDDDDDNESAASVTNDSFIGPPTSHENTDSNVVDLPEGNASGSMPMNIPFVGDVANVNDAAVSTPCSGSLSPNNSACHEDKSIRENSSLLGRLFASWSLSPKSKMIPDDEEEFYVLSDEEIMRSLSYSSPYAPLAGEHSDPGIHICPTRHVDDLINEFSNDMPREFWVNAGKSYVLPVSITNKIAITWEFTTEPKSMAFSLVFRAATSEENEDSIDEDNSIDTSSFLPPTEVLIPVTHCESHLHPIRGKLIAKKPGVYTFYFDNGFSRFMAKKVKFIMRLFKEECKDEEKPSEDQCSVPDCANSLETT